VAEGTANVLVDVTKGCAYLNDVRDTLSAAFREKTLAGVWANEPMRGIRFDVSDVKLHGDSTHRGPRQLNPAMTDAMYGAQLISGARLLEPVYQCDIVVPQSASSGVYSTLRARRAAVVELDDDKDIKTGGGSSGSSKLAGDLVHIQAYLPVAESFGFAAVLRKATAGQAFPQMLFSHWGIMPGELHDPKSLAGAAVVEIRARKGLKAGLPVIDDYHVKL